MRVVLLFLLAACFALSLGQETVTSGPLNTGASSARLREYWTAARMREAIPADISVEGEAVPVAFSQEQLDELSRQVPPVFEEGRDSVLFPSEHDEYLPENDRAKRLLGAFAPSYTTDPWRIVGKVFFTKPDGLNYVCSGAVIRQYVVATAGHCVYGGGWVSNFAFVPGYNNGNRPYGTFSANSLWSNTAWTTSSNLCSDWGFAVMNKLGGWGVGDYTGYLGYSYGGPASPWRSLGYPQAAPFNGQLNYYVDSGLVNTDSPGGCSPGTFRINSDATGGASGGPWINSFGASNYLNSVNSYKYNNDPNSIYGPTFDTLWANTLTSAAAITPP